MSCPEEDSASIPPRFPDFRAFLIEGPNQPEEKTRRWQDVGVFRCRTDRAGNSFLHGRLSLDGGFYVLRLYPLKSTMPTDKGASRTMRLLKSRKAA